MPPPVELWLVRHAESEFNAAGRWQGHADSPLSQRGMEQARAARPVVATFAPAHVVASDLRRAMQTAALASGRDDVVSSTALRERDVGPWSGLTHAEVRARYPEAEMGARPVGFEPDEELVARTQPALLQLCRAYAGKRLLVVSHGGVIRALERAHGLDRPRLRNLEGVRCTTDAGEALWLHERVSLDPLSPA